MHEFLEFTLIGLVLGSAYAVAATGLVVTYSTSGVFNIAHGAIGMFMAFTYWQLSVAWNLNPALAFVITVFILAPILGAVIERIIIRGVDATNVPVTLAITVGLTLIGIGGVGRIWPAEARNVPQFFGNGGFHALGIFISWEDAITIGGAIAIAVALRVFLYGTRIGIAMRGVVDNRDLVGLFGGRPSWLSTLSWSMGASLASIAGILVAPRLQLQPLSLTLLVIDAYAAAVIGRLRSLPMTYLGGLVVGFAASYFVGYLPTSGFWASTPISGLLTESVPSLILFIVLLAYPASRLRGGQLQRKVILPTPSLARSLQGGALLVAAVVVYVSVASVSNQINLGIGLAYGLIALSLIPLSGWGGQISICQLTFAGFGIFAMYRWGSGGSWVGYLYAGGLSGAAGALISIPALRLRGLYLALLTMAFASAMDNMIFAWGPVFGFDGDVHISRLSLFGLSLAGDKSFTIFVAVVFALASIALLALRRGSFGRTLVAMKDSEAACATLGLSLTMTKMAVFALSAAMAGVAGALYGQASSVAGATNVEMLESLIILAAVAMFGVSLCTGALVAGLVLGFLPSSDTALFIGVGVLSLRFYPDGLLTSFYAWLGRGRRLLALPASPSVGGTEPLPSLVPSGSL
ncbi:MAG TPA: ABC transporter permease [Acidimicrobiales bacterium]|jgi:branched-chain amino acid transport system permease protein